MLDGIFDSIKGQVTDTIKEKAGLDATQAEASMGAAKESISEGLMGAVSGGDMSSVMGMFSGGDMAQNGLFKSISNNFVGKLVSNVGIPESMAGMVSASALPMIMNKIKGTVSNDNGEVDQNSLMSNLGMDSSGMMDSMKDKAMDAVKDKMGGLGNLLG